MAQKTTNSDFTSNNAGKYSKCFGNILRDEHKYGDYQNYTLSIEKWDVFKMGDGKDYYRVFIKLSWYEVENFINKHLYSYKGVLTFDEFGCDAMFWVSEQTEYSILGVGKRTSNLTNEQYEASKKLIPDGAKWVAMPTGCLCE
jgi:hypothetical protein